MTRARSQGTTIALVLSGSLVAGIVLLCGLAGVIGLFVPEDPDEAPAAEQPVVTETVTETSAAAEPVEPVVEESEPPDSTYLVADVVDGDTINLDNGESVRLVGIDTPERGECGFGPAQSALKRLVLGKRVTLVESDEDRDRYDRLLRYVDVGTVDVGMRLLRAGLAIARYDSRDGYGRHPREDDYIAADEAAPDVVCKPKPKPQPKPNPEPRGFADTDGNGGNNGGGGNCEPGYSPCVPNYPPDLDCADVGPVTVTGSDPHGLDADGDGRACGGD